MPACFRPAPLNNFFFIRAHYGFTFQLVLEAYTAGVNGYHRRDIVYLSENGKKLRVCTKRVSCFRIFHVWRLAFGVDLAHQSVSENLRMLLKALFFFCQVESQSVHICFSL